MLVIFHSQVRYVSLPGRVAPTHIISRASQAKSGAGSTTLGAGRPVNQGAGGCC